MTVCGCCRFHARPIHQSVYGPVAEGTMVQLWGICLQRIPEIFTGTLVAEAALLGDLAVERRVDETCGNWQAMPPQPKGPGHAHG